MALAPLDRHPFRQPCRRPAHSKQLPQQAWRCLPAACHRSPALCGLVALPALRPPPAPGSSCRCSAPRSPPGPCARRTSPQRTARAPAQRQRQQLGRSTQHGRLDGPNRQATYTLTQQELRLAVLGSYNRLATHPGPGRTCTPYALLMMCATPAAWHSLATATTSSAARGAKQLVVVTTHATCRAKYLLW